MNLPHTQEQSKLINENSSGKRTQYQKKTPSINHRKRKNIALGILALILLALLITYFHSIYAKIQKLHSTLSKLQQNIDETNNQFMDDRTESHIWLSSIKIQKIVSKLTKLKVSHKPKPKSFSINPLPKILWLYTEYRLEAERMVEQFLGRNIMEMGKLTGLEVKMVSSLDAYDHLSEQSRIKITKTMQNMKINEKVNELYKMALLMEHGGLMISPSQILLTQNLSWVFDHFKNNSQTQVLLFSQQHSKSKPIYQDYFLAAVPKADFIVQIFDILCNTISNGALDYEELKFASYVDQQTQAIVIPDTTKNIINGILNIQKHSDYSVSVFHKDNTQRMVPLCQANIFIIMKGTKQQYKQFCGEEKYFINNLRRSLLQKEIQKSLQNSLQQTNNALPESYWYQLLDLKRNFLLFTPLPQRKPQFCILDAETDQNIATIQQSLGRLKQQSFTDWVSVYFVNQVTIQMQQLASLQNRATQKIIFVASSNSLGRNYEKGIISICPPKSFIVLLKRTQDFSEVQSLKTLAENVSEYGVLGAYVSINILGKVRKPQNYYQNYVKSHMNGLNPQYEDLNSILNFLRVFHSDYYKILPQFFHKNNQDQYFNDRFRFLEAFVQMVRNTTQKSKNSIFQSSQPSKWFIKSNYELFDIPKRIAKLQNIVINTDKWEEVDKNQTFQTTFKDEILPFSQTVEHLIKSGHTMSDFTIFNKAAQYQPYTKRNKTELIPKIVHLICLKEHIPEVAKDILKLNKELYPDFSFKIWTKHNITRELFPYNFELLNRILNSNQLSDSHKTITMTDIMREQIIYNEGGFYLDAYLLLFSNVLSKWLSYKLMIQTSNVFTHRWSQTMSIFGAVPRYAGLLRNMEQRNMNRYNIFTSGIHSLSRFDAIKQILRGQEENDPDVLVVDSDAFNPITYKEKNSHLQCWHRPKNSINQQTQPYQNQKSQISRNCAKQYPNSFGLDLSLLKRILP